MARKITLKDRHKMIELWRAGEHSAVEIAQKFGVSKSYANAIFAKYGVKRGEAEKQIKDALTKSMQNQMDTEIEAMAKVIIQKKEFTVNSVDWVNKKTMMIMRQAQEGNVPVANFFDDLKALNMAARTLSTNYATLNKALGMDEQGDDDDNLPSFDINVMTDQMVEKMRDEQEIEDAAIYGSELTEEERLEMEESDDIIEDLEDEGFDEDDAPEEL